MPEIKSDAKPQAAALVAGVDTPEGRSVAISLGKAGYRVCLLETTHLSGSPAVGSSPVLEPSAIPGHDKLQHVAVRVESLDTAAFTSAAKRAESLLGHVTAFVYAAVPAVQGSDADSFDGAAFAAELSLSAGGFLALGLALLPGMFGTQTGVACLLTARPASKAPPAPGRIALLGAQLGAVRELAQRSAGTPLRSIALYVDAPGELGAPALAVLNAQLADSPGPGALESGWFSSLSATPVKGPIDFLRPPPAPVALPAAAAPVAGAGAPSPAAPGKDRVSVQLAQTFRSTFGLAPNADVSNLAIGSVKRWDSLGHLKLMMEVEQTLRVRLPADALSRIQSYKDLEKAVRANLPAK